MEFNKNQPIYLQIAEYVSENILTSKWKEGDRILSVRELSMKLQVNPNTVMRTYNHLQSEEVLYNQRGIGYFISEGSTDKIRKIKKDHYVKVDLPDVFRTGRLLGITPDELSDLYNTYLKEAGK
ncbi:GntR family transcriptional regulator [Spirochaeta isovalerica]|uniref:DNA-binding transcriptional regulator YhcF (GntR family) n=1 Tax=Spirochaeta isovalerica TaxID=150 RepID=A0A841R8W7_9SPIO|nr:GntR family transcriptional regulator [Spirochaeta isovalerica]MBB6478922.1 DNA-binding transcriptional regulator YhcF (GntR family) [Spirochaeta isovalerica]